MTRNVAIFFTVICVALLSWSIWNVFREDSLGAYLRVATGIVFLIVGIISIKNAKD